MISKPNTSGGIVRTVTALATPITEELGVLLWDVRFVKEGADWILRIVIDREDTPVSINDCVAVSRKISPLLDEADPIAQSYCLEVTSPGADRELTRPEHFHYCEGWPVNVKLYRPDADGQKEIAGILESFEENILTLKAEDDTARVFEKKDIAAVHVIDDFEVDLSEGATE